MGIAGEEVLLGLAVAGVLGMAGMMGGSLVFNYGVGLRMGVKGGKGGKEKER